MALKPLLPGNSSELQAAYRALGQRLEAGEIDSEAFNREAQSLNAQWRAQRDPGRGNPQVSPSALPTVEDPAERARRFVQNPRWPQAGASAARGVGEAVSGVLKGYALSDAPQASTFEGLQRIDEGQAPVPLNPLGGRIGQDILPNAQRRLYQRFEAADASERQAIRAELNARVKAAMDAPAYQAGKAVDTFFRDRFPTDAKLDKEFWSSKVPRALGQASVYVASGLATRGLLNAPFL